MKNNLFLISLFVFTLSISAQNKNLKLHYDFNTISTEGKIVDKTGNGYDAVLQNDAYVDEMGNFKVLNLGYANGYLDMGEKTGELIASLGDFTIAVYACVPAGVSLNADGNFLWTFSNSKDILKNQNGCMFFSAKTQGFGITKTDYREETSVQLRKTLPTGDWKHIVYTQSGNDATIYIDGEKVTNGSISLQPKELGKTTCNYIGRSAYLADNYLKGLVTDFRVYNKALNGKEIVALAKNVTALNGEYAEYLKKPVKFIAKQNPLFTHKYTADPAALVHNDVFYLYTGQDTGDGRGYNIPNWLVFSTRDMETWYEHPIPLQTSDFKWAVGNSSWAAQVIERNGKFYWYVSTEHANVDGKRGKAIGVAVADSPTGPFVDARGSALVTNNMTTKWTGISWDDIDPTVWIDDDGQAYIFWGNTQCYYAKLKENMIELDGEIIPVELPRFTEAPWIHKKDDWYYLSYASWFPEKIVYAMSKNIEGPWEYKGILNEVAGNSNTNHQAILEYKGNWYFVYHNGSIPTQGGSYLRSVCIDYLHYNNDGTLKRIQMTTEGVDKIK